MIVSKLIRKAFSFFGLTTKSKNEGYDHLPTDIATDKDFIELYKKIEAYTMVSPERCYALYQSVNYILNKNIPGDFAECGVWKGGSCMLIAYVLKQAGVTDRKIWLYDTFSGMPSPGENDGKKEKDEWQKNKLNDNLNNWCLANESEVRQNMKETHYPFQNFYFVKGKVEETIPAHVPGQLSLLRLDTDWYSSTKHELLHLFPLVAKNGILIIDDYGVWQGAKKATDEYFEGKTYIHRIDSEGRLVIK